jgi:putative membrane protein
MILQSLAGLPAFLVYFCTGLIAVVAYLFVYTRITPHNEFQLIRDNDPAAAIALGLSLLGFVLPVVSAIAHSANVVDWLIWSLIALIVQIVVYFLVKIPVPNLSQRIAEGQMAPAIWLNYSRTMHLSLFGGGDSSTHSSSSGTTESGSVSRGGFGGFAHAFGFSGRS